MQCLLGVGVVVDTVVLIWYACLTLATLINARKSRRKANEISAEDALKNRTTRQQKEDFEFEADHSTQLAWSFGFFGVAHGIALIPLIVLYICILY